LSKADVVVLTTAYRPGKNDNMFDEEAFEKMKNGAIFVNVARGELHNDYALYNALISNKLSAAATDVLKDERKFLFVKNGKPSKIQTKLINLYPRFLFTSHIAYFSNNALSDMAKFSLENIKQLKKNLKFDRRLC
jgi:D-lactate dehydrogenase